MLLYHETDWSNEASFRAVGFDGSYGIADSVNSFFYAEKQEDSAGRGKGLWVIVEVPEGSDVQQYLWPLLPTSYKIPNDVVNRWQRRYELWT